MKFFDLKNSTFLEIIKYLELSDLASLSATCKFFIIFFKKNEDFIQKRALSLLGIEYSPSIFSWKILLLKLYKRSTTKLTNSFNPYYTNGGSHRDLDFYFIWKLIQDECTHCTRLPENVLIKYIFSPDAIINASKNHINYKISENEYYLSYIEENANNQKNSLAEIRKIFIKIPIEGFTCPCEVLMCFSSLNKVEDFSLIQYFYSCKTKEDVMNNAELLKLKARVAKRRIHEIVAFKKSLGQIQPICWVKANFQKCTNKGFWVKTDDKFFGRYFYVLLISAINSPNSINIDISNVTPWSRIIEIGKN